MNEIQASDENVLVEIVSNDTNVVFRAKELKSVEVYTEYKMGMATTYKISVLYNTDGKMSIGWPNQEARDAAYRKLMAIVGGLYPTIKIKL